MFRIRSVFTGVTGTPWYSNLYFQSGSGTAQDAYDAVVNFWGDYAEAAMSNQIQVNVEAQIPNINPVTGDIFGLEVVSPADQIQGANTSEMLPRASQGLLNAHTGIYAGGREIRGKVFMPAPTESSNGTGGQPSVAFRSAITANAVANLIAPATVGWCVWSRKNGSENVVNTVDSPPEFAVLRSRRD